MSSSFTHAVAHVRISFLCKAEWYFIVCIYHFLLIHSSIGGHLGFFYLLATVNSAAVNMNVQISLQDHPFSSFGYIPRSEISGSYGSSIFNILRLLHTVFRSTWTIFNSTNCAQVFQFLHILANTVYLLGFCLFILFWGVFLAVPCTMWDLSSPTRDQTHAPALGAWSLKPWMAREVPIFCFLIVAI